MGHRKIEEAFTRFVKLTTASNHKMYCFLYVTMTIQVIFR